MMSGTLEDRVRRMLAVRPGQSGTQPAPGPELIRFLMHCSVVGQPFVVVAERQGNTLRMIGNEELQTGGRGGAVASPALGSFRFDATAWPGCLHCGARHNRTYDVPTFWTCHPDKGCGQPFHCVGDRAGLFRCACGKIERPGPFAVQDSFEVRGTRSAPPLPAGTPGRSSSPATVTLRPPSSPSPPTNPAQTVPAVRPQQPVTPSPPRLPWKR